MTLPEPTASTTPKAPIHVTHSTRIAVLTESSGEEEVAGHDWVLHPEIRCPKCYDPTAAINPWSDTPVLRLYAFAPDAWWLSCDQCLSDFIMAR